HGPQVFARSSSALSAPRQALANGSPDAERGIIHHKVQEQARPEQLEPACMLPEQGLEQKELRCCHRPGKHRRHPPVEKSVAEKGAETATDPEQQMSLSHAATAPLRCSRAAALGAGRNGPATPAGAPLTSP